MAKKMTVHTNQMYYLEQGGSAEFYTKPYNSPGNKECTLVIHEGKPEKVYTHSEVVALLGEIKRADLFVDTIEDAAGRLGIVLDPMNLPPDILFYAFRYALGRMTYVVHDVASEIIRNASAIPSKDRLTMIKEITVALDKDQAGMDMDRKEWEAVRNTLQQVEP